MIRLTKLLEDYGYRYSSACDYQYSYSCVSPRDYGELEWIIENMKEIDWQEFKRHVSERELEMSGLTEPYKGIDLTLQDDYTVSFYHVEGCYKPNNEYIDAYIIEHSAIEHVFLSSEERYCD